MINLSNIKTLATYLVSIYAVLFIFAYFFAHSMIFLPPRTSYLDSSQIIKIKTPNNQHIAAIYLKNPKAKYTVLISHGNAEDLGYILFFVREWQKQGFNVLAYDYEGYGLSSGYANEKNVYGDIDAAYNYLVKKEHVKPDHIIAYGRSIGSAITINLATQHKLKAVILEGTFLTAFRVITRIPLLPFDQFDNLSKINKIKIPKLFIHGRSDHIVPFYQGERIYKLAPQPKAHFWVKGAGHNDLFHVTGAKKYFTRIHEFVNKLK